MVAEPRGPRGTWCSTSLPRWGVKKIMDEPSQSILTNVGGTENVLKACVPLKRPVFVASTSEVYGKATKFPFQEDDDLVIGATKNIRWSYASAKQIDEFLTLAYVREAALPAVILRFFNTTGPRQTGRYGMVLPSFVSGGARRPPAQGPRHRRAVALLWHVADVVEALVRLMDTPSARGEVFNVANDQEVTIRGLAEKVIEMTGSSSKIELIPYSEAYPPGSRT